MTIEPLALTMGASFELERMNRTIDALTVKDFEELKKLTKQLAQAWQSQKAATAWVMKHNLGAPSRVTPETLAQAPQRPSMDVL